MRLHISTLFLFLSMSLMAQNVDLTLIPPSKITNKVDLDIRVGIRNNEDRKLDCKFEISASLGSETSIVCQGSYSIAAGQSYCISQVLNTADRVGKNTINVRIVCDSTVITKSKVIDVVNSDIRSTRTIDGAWIGFYHWSELEGKHWNNDIKKLTEEDWFGVIRAMHNIGMDIVVLQETFRNEEYVGQHQQSAQTYKGKAYYPSELYPGRMGIATVDPIEVVLSEADKLGMNVFMGVGMYAWFDFSPESLLWHKNVARELWDRYGHHASFYGFYVSEESGGSLDNWEKTPELRALRREQIADFFEQFKLHCNSFAPSKPIMLATNSMGLPGSEQAYSKLLPNLDILCPFGFARMPEGNLSGQEAALLLQKWCDEHNSHLWFDLEAFSFYEDSSLYPRDFEGIVSDLTMFDNFEKVLCYQYPGVFGNTRFHPQVGEPKSLLLYQAYSEYLESLRSTTPLR